jgi:hypothetical protein
MTFKKIKWNESETLFETKVKDGTGRLLEKWNVLKYDFPSVVRILNDKYSLNMEIKRKNKTEKKEDKDLDWALK